MSNYFYVVWAVILSLFLGCTHQNIRAIYYSEPEIQEVSNAAFDARIEIEKQKNPFYVSFQLTLTNKTNAALAIDWNRTRYLHKGEDLGVFVFQGIDPESVKTGIPKETVAPRATLSKRISPHRTLALRSMRDTAAVGQSGIYAGILPGGTNTVRLVVDQADRTWETPMSFNLITQKLPK
ncbi:conserved hypothetical protein [Desulfosarcina cetonica]|uniref:hypothetical protein n=1 Tax=Desulfosarcina cetonica TaxID=90730 RepID=UPI0006CFA9EC|nr:hypothetical protein [Desulfosarcina cetonica]VTR69944.1 conserved hypothetical protein [Desulfosarcina cetonica]